ncbi:MAG TPA: hypothetical protein VG900_11325 [Hyphomicrobiaceae bacterium]|jgi:hypothetical protein|nr:hypothetical protein [Hyphomicrobiaceae bacterium]
MQNIRSPGLKRILLVAAALPSLAAAAPCLAQTAPDSTTAPVQTEQDKREKAERDACAAKLCPTLHTGKPDTGSIVCNLRKRWSKDTLSKIMARGHVSWPWGDAHCATKISFDRAKLAQAAIAPQVEAQFDKSEVHCQLAADNTAYEVTVEVQPKVTFKQGKAVKANMNWGKIDAPKLAKSALWSVTAADNTFGLLQSIATEEINNFIENRCLEAKEEWQQK